MSEAALATPRGDSAPTVEDDFTPPADLAACGTWYVAHCKSRTEKLFAAELARQGVPCFLPIRQRVSIATNKRHIVREPLFPGYAFFAGDYTAIECAKSTRRLVMILPANDQAKMLTDLTKIKSAIEADPMLDARPGIVAGRYCVITGGPLMGCQGVVERLGPRSIVVVRINILGQSVACDLPQHLLELI